MDFFKSKNNKIIQVEILYIHITELILSLM